MLRTSLKHRRTVAFVQSVAFALVRSLLCLCLSPSAATLRVVEWIRWYEYILSMIIFYVLLLPLDYQPYGRLVLVLIEYRCHPCLQTKGRRLHCVVLESYDTFISGRRESSGLWRTWTRRGANVKIVVQRERSFNLEAVYFCFLRFFTPIGWLANSKFVFVFFRHECFTVFCPRFTPAVHIGECISVCDCLGKPLAEETIHPHRMLETLMNASRGTIDE